MPSYKIIVTYDTDEPLDRDELMERWDWRLLSFNRRVPLKDDPRRAEAEQTGLLTSLDKVIELGMDFCRENNIPINANGIMHALERMLSDIERDGAEIDDDGPEESQGEAEAKDEEESQSKAEARNEEPEES
ncbi:hypothetical protein MIND_00003000 [Mycena indigotica]|uniref:Uncharacterized protein n=1 Tax=Mycena indigotica TaxID=2126181 RepID=A0A8H6TDX0_9AGAR|nr:uncharacterized protein MIND_00003000 [Mycena indigotica]KAF7314892.1 hypothetical protein MIND_00003000 [Mycena indigotica]